LLEMKKLCFLAPLLSSCLAQPGSAANPDSPECLVEALIPKKTENYGSENTEYYGLHQISAAILGSSTGSLPSLLYRIKVVADDSRQAITATCIDLPPWGDVDVAYKMRRGEPVRYLQPNNQSLQEFHTLALEALERYYCLGQPLFIAGKDYLSFQNAFEKIVQN